MFQLISFLLNLVCLVQHTKREKSTNKGQHTHDTGPFNLCAFHIGSIICETLCASINCVIRRKNLHQPNQVTCSDQLRNKNTMLTGQRPCLENIINVILYMQIKLFLLTLIMLCLTVFKSRVTTSPSCKIEFIFALGAYFEDVSNGGICIH